MMAPLRKIIDWRRPTPQSREAGLIAILECRHRKTITKWPRSRLVRCHSCKE